MVEHILSHFATLPFLFHFQFNLRNHLDFSKLINIAIHKKLQPDIPLTQPAPTALHFIHLKHLLTSISTCKASGAASHYTRRVFSKYKVWGRCFLIFLFLHFLPLLPFLQFCQPYPLTASSHYNFPYTHYNSPFIYLDMSTVPINPKRVIISPKSKYIALFSKAPNKIIIIPAKISMASALKTLSIILGPLITL